MKQYRTKCLGALVVLAVLAGAFFWGGNAPGLQNAEANRQTSSLPTNATTQEAPATAQAEEKEAAPPGQAIDTTAGAKADAKPSQAKGQPPSAAKPTPSSTTTAEQTPDFASRPGGATSDWSAEQKLETAQKLSGNTDASAPQSDPTYSAAQGMALNKGTGEDQYGTTAVPDGKPIPMEPQNAVISDELHSCTLSIRCDSILQNLDWLDPEKVELVPEDGIVFVQQTVSFYKGESVFNLLLRECKRNNIHLEFANTPIYNSAYIEGIHNLYEFDCGELSGWIYKVNDWFPNYGCSRYALQEGDVVELLYTCNLGVDVGAFVSIGA